MHLCLISQIRVLDSQTKNNFIHLPTQLNTPQKTWSDQSSLAQYISLVGHRILSSTNPQKASLMESWFLHTSRSSQCCYKYHQSGQGELWSQRPLFSFSSDLLCRRGLVGVRTEGSLFATASDWPAFLSLNGLPLFDAADRIALGNFRGMSPSLALLLPGFWGASMLSGCEDGGGSETSRTVDVRHFFLWLGFDAFDLTCISYKLRSTRQADFCKRNEHEK